MPDITGQPLHRGDIVVPQYLQYLRRAPIDPPPAEGAEGEEYDAGRSGEFGVITSLNSDARYAYVSWRQLRTQALRHVRVLATALRLATAEERQRIVAVAPFDPHAFGLARDEAKDWSAVSQPAPPVGSEDWDDEQWARYIHTGVSAPTLSDHARGGKA